MAIEHEPGCDRQHTARQRCNQNGIFAEQGEVTPDGDATAVAPEPAAKPARARRQATPARRPPPSALTELPAQEVEPPVQNETVDEIVSIREEIVAQEHHYEPVARLDHQPLEHGGQRVPAALILALAAFGIVTAILLVMLLRGGHGDPAGAG